MLVAIPDAKLADVVANAPLTDVASALVAILVAKLELKVVSASVANVLTEALVAFNSASVAKSVSRLVILLAKDELVDAKAPLI